MNRFESPELVARLRRLGAHMWRHFKQDRCFEEAASLSYTSLISLVPLLAVVFGVASAFPVFDRWVEQLQSFIFDNLVPTSGAQVEGYIASFLDSVSRLTLPGTFVLILTALLLMVRIEKAFNRIWRVPTGRSVVNRIVMYWAVLTLGPITLGVATALSSDTVFRFIGSNGDGASALGGLGFFVLSWLAYCLVFLLVPNRRVWFRHAALGALVSALLFTAARAGFVWFVARASYNVIYGTLATIPIFLLWLYLVWAVTLLGASLAASLTTFRDRGGGWRWPWEWELLLAFRLVGHLWEAQRDGKALPTEALMNAEPGMSATVLQRLLGNFIEADMVTQDQRSNWLLTRDLDHFTVLDLYRAGHFHLPLGRAMDIPTGSKWDQAFLRLLASDGPRLDVPLKPLYEAEET